MEVAAGFIGQEALGQGLGVSADVIDHVVDEGSAEKVGDFWEGDWVTCGRREHVDKK